MNYQIFHGDNRKIVSSWKSNYVDGIITDPPYELGFMGKSWDASGIAYSVPLWKQLLRVTKPGGFLLCFGGTRTYHRLACAIEDAGWQIRDCMMWLYGSGFPKSHNIGKAIDKLHGNKRNGTGVIKHHAQKGVAIAEERTAIGGGAFGKPKDEEITIGNTEWEGYGTALKPAWEPIIVAMKPKEGSFADNAEKWGVAGLNIDGGRIPTDEIKKNTSDYSDKGFWGNIKEAGKAKRWTGNGTNNPQGRWPANLILDEEAGKMLDEQSGISKSPKQTRKSKVNVQPGGNGKTMQKGWTKREIQGHADSGGASRFFYCAKTSRKERNMGLEDCEDKLLARSGGAQEAEHRGEKEYLQNHIGLNRVAVVKNNHPTVKPLALMKYLCTLLKMPSADQIILDPFMGSGTTGMACAELGIGFIGIEKELDYCEISSKRIGSILGKPLPVIKNVETVRTTPSFVSGGGCPNENSPHVSESRQRIINAASAELHKRRNQK